MNRLVRGSIMFVAAAGAWACKTNLGENADTTDHLVATPSVVLVANTDSQAVDVEALNPQNEQLAADFVVSNVGAGLVVRQDTSFLPEPGGHSPVRARFIVRGTSTTTFVSASFTVSANNKNLIVPVTIVPATLDVPFSNPTPALGDTVTLSAPAGIHFTSGSVVTIPNGVAVVAGLSADSSQMFLLFGPGITQQPATITNVVNDFLPGQTFALTTTGTVTTPALTTFNPGYSTTTPNVNEDVTLTAAGFKFLPGVEVRFGNDVQTVTSIASDSNSLTFRAHKPGASGTVSVAGMALSFLTTVPVTLDATGPGVTVTATINTLAGVGAIATAPEIQIPSTGKTGGVIDNGPFVSGPAVCSGALGGPCRVYKIVLTAPRTFSLSVSWNNTTDLGVYRSVDGVAATNIGCDVGGNGAGGQPETCTITALPAGTYYLVVDSFAPFYGPPDNVDPTQFTMDITGG